MSMRLKKGDQVTVNTGKDKGKVGEVMKILGMKAIVKGVNISKKHQKQDQKNEGGVLNKEMPIMLSNLLPGIPNPVLIPPAEQFDEVTYGKVP